MQEVEFARETLKFAQMFLHMGVTNTWLYRMLVGRLYYAAHHLGRRVLIETSLQPEQWRANVHRRVLDELNRQYVTTIPVKAVDRNRQNDRRLDKGAK